MGIASAIGGIAVAARDGVILSRRRRGCVHGTAAYPQWFVLIAPFCAAFTGRWLRTAVVGVWAICLVVVLAVPDGIWGTRLEMSLIGVALFVAVSSTLILLITLRAALSLAVTACGSHGTSPGRPAVSARPVSCHQQSETWKHGPGQAEISELAATLKTIRAAEKSGDVPALATGMKKLMPAAVILAKHPIPVCADPGKLYAGFTDRTYTAGYNARSAKGLSGLVKAAARLKGLKTIESRLTAELNHALAKN